jgi:DNA polymerase
MSLDLDARQRAMLLEMGLRIWQRPAVDEATATPASPAPVRAAARAADPAQPTTATAPAITPTAPIAPVTSVAPIELATADGAPIGWPLLQQTVASCQACGLCAGRKAAVFGAAPDQAQADWLVVGEPPDEQEEREGQAFAGSAGQLLDNMLKALALQRGAGGALGAYVTNIVKCRPATPRNPSAQELGTCQRYLQAEIALVRPRLILAMGRFAAQSLLQASVPDAASIPLGKLRGQVYRYQGLPVVVSYHPTYLLRTQADKAKAWADLCLALATLDAPASDNS